MSYDTEENTCSPSTTTRWKWAKIAMPPAGPQDSASQRLLRLSRRAARDPLTVTVRYRGGSEDWWELRARGRVWRRPGHLCLTDVLLEINEGHGGKPSN